MRQKQNRFNLQVAMLSASLGFASLLSGCGETKIEEDVAVTPPASFDSSSMAVPPGYDKVELGSTKPVFKHNDIYIAGQPAADDMQALKDAGITRVISVRGEGEIDWDEKAAVEAAGMEFFSIPMAAPEDMTDEALTKIRGMLNQSSEKPVMLHCGAASRAAAIWMTYNAIDEKAGVEDGFKNANRMLSIPDQWAGPAGEYVVRESKK